MADSATGPRCDRCGHAAKIEYLLADEIWQFCAHHAREHDRKLRDLGYIRNTINTLAYNR